MLRRVIISGGGTGGHVFPALAIANEIKSRNPDCSILFVGAIGKMEMEKIPQAGYRIVGLPITGLQRKWSLSNLLLPYKLLRSIFLAKDIVRQFKPEAVVGVGGYASSALLFAAHLLKIPILIQEQNSYAGLTNKLLAGKAKRICVAYEGMEKYFPANKLVVTGNPVRSELYNAVNMDAATAKKDLGFSPDKPLALVIGGSLGARTINQSIQNAIPDVFDAGVQLLWQTGKHFKPDTLGYAGIKASQFIADMCTAYAAADIVVSRAGAISVSELALLGKPCILVPSPNVAEDHQTKNAKALTDKHAAIFVSDADAPFKLSAELIALIHNKARQAELRQNILRFGKPDALTQIVNELEGIIV